MPDYKDETKPDAPSLVVNKPTNFGAKGIHARVANANNNPLARGIAGSGAGGVNSNRFVNFAKIFILPDTSGSMDTLYDGVSASELSKRAISEYLKNCNPAINKVGVASFPELVFVEATSLYQQVETACSELTPTGSTPLAEAFGYVLEQETPTHAVIISDGDADEKDENINIAKHYKDKNITVDCVHIGSSRGGEELLKKIAETTGGIYIKFTDVHSFAKNFSFLTPAKRVQLLTSSNPIALLGASDVKL